VPACRFYGWNSIPSRRICLSDMALALKSVRITCGRSEFSTKAEVRALLRIPKRAFNNEGKFFDFRDETDLSHIPQRRKGSGRLPSLGARLWKCQTGTWLFGHGSGLLRWESRVHRGYLCVDELVAHRGDRSSSLVLSAERPIGSPLLANNAAFYGLLGVSYMYPHLTPGGASTLL
jgi:hypothetical protein